MLDGYAKNRHTVMEIEAFLGTGTQIFQGNFVF